MAADILTRTLATVALLSAGAALYWLVNRAWLSRLRGRDLGLESFRPGTPAILYFTAPGCVPCKTVQRPAIQALKGRFGEHLQVIEVDAVEQPALADYWGVLSVPTTFIIDARGRPRRVNHGVIGAQQLLRQIQEIEPKSTSQVGVLQFESEN